MVVQTTTRMPSDLDVKKSLGREYRASGRIREALLLFSELHKTYPQDMETTLMLGDLYVANNQETQALQVYISGLKIEPHNPEILRRLKLYAQDTDAITEPAQPEHNEEIPIERDQVAHLLQWLTGRETPISDVELEAAAVLLNEIINSPSPAQEVARRLDEIDSLMPALLELNIRQARQDGRSDLASALLELQTNILLQVEAHRQSEAQLSTKPASPSSASPGVVRSVRTAFRGNVQIMAPSVPGAGSRLGQLLPFLKEQGCKVNLAAGVSFDQAEKPDVVITTCPHVDQRLMAALAAYSAAGIPIILDLDVDYEEMPVAHANYTRMGLGNPANARNYLAATMLSHTITVPTRAFAEAFTPGQYQVKVIPDGWSSQDALWSKPSPLRTTTNIGWIGSSGQLDDLSLVRRALPRVIRQYPHSQLVIAGDARAYQLFDNLPVNRKLFLPDGPDEDYPYMFSQFDILIVPMRNIPFNRYMSDKFMVEAGVRHIPWIASPLPSTLEWKVGGIQANSPDEWYAYISQLVVDPGLRASLAEEGYHRSMMREMKELGQIWLETIEQILAQPAQSPR